MVTVVAAELDILQFPNFTPRRRQIQPAKCCGLSIEYLQTFIRDNN
jgi:hypothetical protein